ncbi:ATP-binding protein [Pseudomonas sp. KCJK9016]|uniref:ATP-binding protein n=1 Tax=Pseudomonas sp. KCJK9016 TaxID=3344556 RepID=UPI003906409C
MSEKRIKSWRWLSRKKDTNRDFPSFYHRHLLVGVGVAITLAILGVTLAIATIKIVDAAREVEHEFNDEQEPIKVFRDAYYKSLIVSVKSYELHKEHPRYDVMSATRYRNLLSENGEVFTTLAGSTQMLMTLVSSLVSADDDIKFADRLQMTIALMNTPLRFQLRNNYYGMGAFIYSTDHRFLASWPSLSEEKSQLVRGEGALKYIEQSVADIERQIDKISSSELYERRVVWLDPLRSPITGQWVSQFAVPIYERDKRIAVMVVEIPFDRFGALFQNGRPIYRFFVLSRDLRQIFDLPLLDKQERYYARMMPEIIRTYGEAQPVYELPRLESGDIPQNPHVNVHFAGGELYVYQRVAGPEWLAVYVVDWCTLIWDVRESLIYILVLSIISIGVLWVLIFLFDYKILVPLQIRSKQVYEGEAFNRVILATAPVGLIVYESGSNVIVMQNDVARELLGSMDETSREFGYLDKNIFLIAEESFLDSPNEIGVVKRAETLLTTTSGVKREVSIAYARARYQQREVVVLGLIDISDQKATLRLLEHAREMADQANQSKSMFLATMSHEIRTPLHGALGNLELLAIDHLTGRQQERVSTIRRAFDTLLLLINDILDLSKIEAGELCLNETPFRVDELVEHCAQTFMPLLLERNLRFFCLVDPRLGGVWLGDGHRINQLLMNLLNNARKFTDKGSITLQASLFKSSDLDPRVLFSVSDTGIGIPALQLNRIFDPFVQANNTIASKYGGTGLGLALCKKVVSLMGGDIWVESEEGKGSVFNIVVPLTRYAQGTQTDPSIVRPAFSKVVVICDSQPWRSNLMELIRCWLPEVDLISGEAENPVSASDNKTVIVFSTSLHDVPGAWAEAQHTYLDRLVLLSDGPLAPERRSNSLYLTSLSASSIKRALELCGQVDTQIGFSLPTVVRRRRDRGDVKLLVAEDDPVNRTLIKHQLAVLGYWQVDIVPDGKAALDLCIAGVYDVVITDLGMPIMDGQTLLAELRQRNIDVPVVVTTAETVAMSQAKFLGFYEILYKPITLDQLKAAIDDVLKTTLLNEHVSEGTSEEGCIDKEMQELFVAGWKKEQSDLLMAFRMNDTKWFLARIHRLKGALLALQEYSLVDGCDALSREVSSKGIQACNDMVERFLIRMESLVDAYKCVI